MIAVLTAGPNPNGTWVGFGLLFCALLVLAAIRGRWIKGLLIALAWYALAVAVALLAVVAFGPNPNPGWVVFALMYLGVLGFVARRGGWSKVVVKVLVITVIVGLIATAIGTAIVLGGLSSE